MTKKEQNAKLTALKADTLGLMSFLEDNVIEGARILNEGELNNDALEIIQTYLMGEGSLKTMRAALSKARKDFYIKNEPHT